MSLLLLIEDGKYRDDRFMEFSLMGVIWDYSLSVNYRLSDYLSG